MPPLRGPHRPFVDTFCVGAGGAAVVVVGTRVEDGTGTTVVGGAPPVLVMTVGAAEEGATGAEEDGLGLDEPLQVPKSGLQPLAGRQWPSVFPQ